MFDRIVVFIKVFQTTDNAADIVFADNLILVFRQNNGICSPQIPYYAADIIISFNSSIVCDYCIIRSGQTAPICFTGYTADIIVSFHSAMVCCSIDNCCTEIVSYDTTDFIIACDSSVIVAM